MLCNFWWVDDMSFGFWFDIHLSFFCWLLLQLKSGISLEILKKRKTFWKTNTTKIDKNVWWRDKLYFWVQLKCVWGWSQTCIVWVMLRPPGVASQPIMTTETFIRLTLRGCWHLQITLLSPLLFVTFVTDRHRTTHNNLSFLWIYNC